MDSNYVWHNMLPFPLPKPAVVRATCNPLSCQPPCLRVAVIKETGVQYHVISDKVCCLGTKRPTFGNEHWMYILDGELKLWSRCLWTDLFKYKLFHSLLRRRLIQLETDSASVVLESSMFLNVVFKGSCLHFGNVFTHCLAESWMRRSITSNMKKARRCLGNGFPGSDLYEHL